MVEPTRRVRPPLRTSKSGIAGLTVEVLATILPPIVVSAPALAQSQTGWHVEDDPTLFGPEQWWFSGEPGKGFGPNNYRYTLAIGGESEADNWAHWYMGNREGTQEIQAYIPQNHATATVNYHIYKDNSLFREVQIDQSASSGWTSLGRFVFNGADVVLAVFDNDAVENYKRNGRSQSQIAVDAIRMRCEPDCGSTERGRTIRDGTEPPTSPTPPSEGRSVEISLRSPYPGILCDDGAFPCESVSIILWGFESLGPYDVTCDIEFDEDGETRGIISENTQYFTYSTDNTVVYNSRTAQISDCYVALRPGARVYVTVDGVKSNTLTISAEDARSGSTGSRPGKPQIHEIYLTDDHHGGTGIVVRWGPPADARDGLIGVRVTVTDPNGRDWSTEFPTSTGGYQFGNFGMTDPAVAFTEFGTYSVSVAAINSYGLGPAARVSIEVPRSAVPPSDKDEERPAGKPGAPERAALEVTGEGARTRLVASWSPPADDGGAPITKYRIFLYRYKGRGERDRVLVAARSVATASRRLTIERSPVFGANYVISVGAENEHGRGENKESRTRTVDCEKIRNKWTRKKFGERRIWGRPVPGTGRHHVVAEVTFVTIDGDEIRDGTRGGIVSSGNTNLSQTGCSWIYDTNNARVVGSAWVSGNAIVTGGRVVRNARVYGNARISGGTIGGDAAIGGDVEINSGTIVSGTLDGKEEYISSLLEGYDAIYKQILSDLRKCGSTKNDEESALREYTRILIDVNDRRPHNRSSVKELHGNCIERKLLVRLIMATKPGWASLLSKKSGMLLTLRDWFNAVKDFDENDDIDKVFRHLRRLYSEVSKKCQSDSDCRCRLRNMTRPNWSGPADSDCEDRFR